MEFSSLASVLKAILLDWRVLAAFAGVLLYLNFFFYIARYRKKKRAPFKSRIKRAPKLVAAEVASGEGAAENADSDERD